MTLFSPSLRSCYAAMALSAWMVALFSGLGPPLAIHILLVAGLLLFPWRALIRRS